MKEYEAHSFWLMESMMFMTVFMMASLVSWSLESLIVLSRSLTIAKIFDVLIVGSFGG